MVPVSTVVSVEVDTVYGQQDVMQLGRTITAIDADEYTATRVGHPQKSARHVGVCVDDNAP